MASSTTDAGSSLTANSPRSSPKNFCFQKSKATYVLLASRPRRSSEMTFSAGAFSSALNIPSTSHSPNGFLTRRAKIPIHAMNEPVRVVAGILFPKAHPYLPSALGLGLSWVMVFENSLSFAIGAVLVAAWSRLSKKGSDLYYVPIASGLIAGESLIAALIAIACTVVGLLAARGGGGGRSEGGR